MFLHESSRLFNENFLGLPEFNWSLGVNVWPVLFLPEVVACSVVMVDAMVFSNFTYVTSDSIPAYKTIKSTQYGGQHISLNINKFAVLSPNAYYYEGDYWIGFYLQTYNNDDVLSIMTVYGGFWQIAKHLYKFYKFIFPYHCLIYNKVCIRSDKKCRSSV